MTLRQEFKDPENTTSEFVCMYYESCVYKECGNPESHPKCFCLCDSELNLLCAYIHKKYGDGQIEFLKPNYPIPYVDKSTQQRYLSLPPANTDSISPPCIAAALKKGYLKEYNAEDNSCKKPGIFISTDANQINILDYHYIRYFSSLLCGSYVLKQVLQKAKESVNTETSQNGLLLRILAGLLYYDYSYAEDFFAKTTKHLLEAHKRFLELSERSEFTDCEKDEFTQLTCTIEDLLAFSKTLVSEIEKWHIDDNSVTKEEWAQTTCNALKINSLTEKEKNCYYYAMKLFVEGNAASRMQIEKKNKESKGNYQLGTQLAISLTKIKDRHKSKDFAKLKEIFSAYLNA